MTLSFVFLTPVDHFSKARYIRSVDSTHSFLQDQDQICRRAYLSIACDHYHRPKAYGPGALATLLSGNRRPCTGLGLVCLKQIKDRVKLIYYEHVLPVLVSPGITCALTLVDHLAIQRQSFPWAEGHNLRPGTFAFERGVC